MAKFESFLWEPSSDYALPRSKRRRGAYSAYIPDKLQGRSFVLTGDVAADIADAEREIAGLNASSASLADTEGLARLLLRAESVASSRIEGLVIGPRRLLKADMARQIGMPIEEAIEAEVLANIDAMAFALTAIDRNEQFSDRLLCDIHAALLAPTSYAHSAGQIRTSQNWIGGSNYGPIHADFVPPPHELVHDLLVDLCDFCNADSLPAVAQAAVAHAQFETIHPFPDGNGRVGRALIHMILRRRGLTTRVTPPISLVLATRAKDYVAGLNGTRYVGEPSSSKAMIATNNWLETFASACRRSITDANHFETKIRDIQAMWFSVLGHMRSDSAAARLLSVLPGTPMVTAAGAAALIDRSLQSTLEGIQRLVKAGILSPTMVGRQRGQVFEAKDVIAAFTALERQLASPVGDTKIKKPVRPVPALVH
jgi:Fic family protein